MRELKPKWISLWMFIFLASAAVQAQPDLGECDQEIDEVTAAQIPRALQAWRQNNARETERYLNKALRLNDSFADALYLLAEMNFRQQKIRQAVYLWERLLKVCPDYKPQVNFALGLVYAEQGEYALAEQQLQNFLNNPERDFGFDREAKAALAETQMRRALEENPVPFDPQLVQRVSTPADEYLASISPDQRKLFFTRRSRKVIRNDGPAAKTRLVEEFCLANWQEEGQFEVGEALPSPFNTSYNEGGPSITANNTELYFTVCEDLNGYQNCDIYFSELDAYGYWTTPRSIGDQVNRRDSWESQPSVTADGRWLYFVSNREGGIGGLDLYRCQRSADGTWSAPQLLSAKINTTKDEKSPFIHSDSQTLYFTSNGHPGMGGFDIFYAKAFNDTAWQAPSNIGYPINSAEDDLGLFVSLDGLTAYFASNNLRANGGWDLYQFDLHPAARPQEVALLTGQLETDDPSELEGATLEIKNLKTKEVKKVAVDNETGRFAQVVSRDQADLILTVKKKGAAFSSNYIAAQQLKQPQSIETKLQVAPLEVGREYQLNDINFSTNSFQLDEAAKAVIDEFVLFMQENPAVRAEIQGHTDNVGDPGSNLTLSRNRARTVYQYALSKGLSASRIKHQGYGESKPIADNNTEAGKAANRRTVFVITAYK